MFTQAKSLMELFLKPGALLGNSQGRGGAAGHARMDNSGQAWDGPSGDYDGGSDAGDGPDSGKKSPGQKKEGCNGEGQPKTSEKSGVRSRIVNSTQYSDQGIYLSIPAQYGQCHHPGDGLQSRTRETVLNRKRMFVFWRV